MNAMKTFTSSGCVKHASGMCVCTVYGTCTYTGVVYNLVDCVLLLCEVDFFRACVLGRAATCLFLDVVTAPYSTVTVSLVFCVISVSDRCGPARGPPIRVQRKIEKEIKHNTCRYVCRTLFRPELMS